MNLHRDLRLAPSILSADFARLADDVAEIEDVAHLLHLDVMDGHYVPNLTLGPALVRSLRHATSLPFDTHLMITDPRAYGPPFIAAGSDSVTFHPETDDDPRGLVDVLRAEGAEVGVAIRPSQRIDDHAHVLDGVDMVLCMTVEPGFAGQSFIPAGLDNVARAVEMRERQGLDFRIEVDGGVSVETAARCVEAGADTLVAGSAVFGADDRRAAARAILEAARQPLTAGSGG
jgi:ribulose-phosphate 3-epimerase